MKHFVLETQRLNIVPLQPDMAEDICRNSLDEDVRRFVPDEVFATPEEAADTIAWLISCYDQPDGPFLYPVLLKDGTNIGYVQLCPIRDGWEIGYHIAKVHTGRGYAAEAVSAFLPAIAKKKGIDTVQGICLAENAASVRVLEKCGFVRTYEGPRDYQGETRNVIMETWRL